MEVRALPKTNKIHHNNKHPRRGNQPRPSQKALSAFPRKEFNSVSPVYSNGMEVKYSATYLTTLGNLSSTVTDINLSTLVGQGPDMTNRIGRELVFTDFRIAGTLKGGQANGVADDAWNSVRFVLYTSTVGYSLVGNLNLSTTLDSRIVPGYGRTISDVTYLLPVQSKDSVGYIPSMKEFRLHHLLAHRQVYTGSTGASASGECLHLAIVSDSTLTPFPTFVSGAFEVAWYDK